MLTAARDGASRGATVVRASSLPAGLPTSLASLADTMHGPEIVADVLTGSARASSSHIAEADKLRALRRAVAERGGSLVLERAPLGVVEEVGAYASADSTADLSRALKGAFDPGGVLSPARFVP